MDSSSTSVADHTKGDAKGTNPADGSIQSTNDVSEWVLLEKSDVGLNPIKSSDGGLPLPNIPVWAKWVLGSIFCIAVPLYKRIRRIEDGVDKTAETTIEVIEKVAEVTEKVASNIANALPGDNNLKEAALKIEDIAELVYKDAEIAEAFIHKPRRMDEKQSPRPPSKSGFLDWQMENYEKEMFMAGYVIANRSVTDLLQNCDLPPPLKLFTPLDEEEKGTARSDRDDTLKQENSQLEQPPRWENSRLMRALQLSQTRAREAEKKASLASIKNHQMAAVLLEESLRLSAHRRWIRMLEAETSMLRKKLLHQEKEEQAEEEEETAAATWYFALALCLGIAGVGFALGRCMF